MSQSDSNSKVPQYLKPSFQPRSAPGTSTSTLYTYRSLAGDLANMAAEKRKSVPSLAKSIDAVLDTPAAIAPSLRPLAKLRPSWIGPARPDRPKTPGAEIMKQHIIIEYSSDDLQPPVYVFTDLSDPPWEAIEMLHEKRADGQHKFTQPFYVEEGEYQYKFRLGSGDWWSCDETKPTVDDGFGNKNNSIRVKAEETKPNTSKFEQMKVESQKVTALLARSPPANDSTRQTPAAISTPAENKSFQSIPRNRDEWVPPSGAQSQQTPEREKADPIAQDADPETVAAQNGDETDTTTAVDFESTTDDDTIANEDSSQSDSDTDYDDKMPMAPLLRHESLRPSSKEQNQAPLFRHEATSIDNHRHDLDCVTKPDNRTSPCRASYTTASPKFEDAERKQYKVVQVPSDFASVMSLVHQVSMTAPHPIDDVFDTHTHDDDPGLRTSSGSSSFSSTLLTSVSEEVDEEAEEELERIRDVEEKEFEREEASGEEMDPLVEALTASTEEDEPEDSDFAPKVVIEERIVLEVVERRRSLKDGVCDRIGGRQNALAVALGLLAVAAAIISMRLL